MTAGFIVECAVSVDLTCDILIFGTCLSARPQNETLYDTFFFPDLKRVCLQLKETSVVDAGITSPKGFSKFKLP